MVDDRAGTRIIELDVGLGLTIGTTIAFFVDEVGQDGVPVYGEIVQ